MENTTDVKAEQVKEYAIECYRSGLNCAESVFYALMKVGAIPEDKAEAVAMCTGFGGGIGLCGETCGALSAAVLANGLLYGRKNPYAVPAQERGEEVANKYYRRYNNLVNDFIEQNGSASCGGITGKYEDWLCKERRVGCLKLIGETAKLAYEYLQIPQEEAFTMPYKNNLRKIK